MNLKKGLVAMVGAFVVIFATEFVIHHVWLGPFYKAHAQWWRPEADMQSMMHLMLLAQLAMAMLLTIVYTKGYETGKDGVAQGARFGLLIGLLLLLPNSLMYYCIYPYPMSLIVSWFVGGLIELTLAGAVIGMIYKPAKQHSN